jgi:uncharacterized OB-fold protein
MKHMENNKTITKAKCKECGRVFDMLDEDDANEYWNGHDCEETA